jgi:hypothetical protein
MLSPFKVKEILMKNVLFAYAYNYFYFFRNEVKAIYAAKSAI